MDCQNQKTCILIAGMHRSGTSALARVVNLHGYAIANNLLSPSYDNEAGYWESVDVYLFHEKLLEEIGLSWSSVLPFANSFYTSTYYSDALSWIKEHASTEYESSNKFLVKDPRISRFLFVWKDALENLKIDVKVLISFRCFSEVASSLNRREIENVLHQGEPFCNQYLGLLWLRYLLEAEKMSRGLNRSFIAYSSFLEDWRQVSKKIEIDLDLKWNPEESDYEQKINLFIRPELHRSKNTVIEGVGQLSWINDTFEALKLLELDPYDLTAMRTLEKINEELARADNIFTEIIKESETKAKHLKSKEEKNQQQIADLQDKLAQIEHERNEAMQDSFQELRLERDKLVSQVQDLSAQVTSLTQENENSKVSDDLTKDKIQFKHE